MWRKLKYTFIVGATVLAWLMFLETSDSLKPLESSCQCYNFIGNLLLTIKVLRETNNKLCIIWQVYWLKRKIFFDWDMNFQNSLGVIWKSSKISEKIIFTKCFSWTSWKMLCKLNDLTKINIRSGSCSGLGVSIYVEKTELQFRWAVLLSVIPQVMLQD